METGTKILEQVRPKVFRTIKFFESKLDKKKILSAPEKLACAVRSCDGTYHVVYSDIPESLKKTKSSKVLADLSPVVRKQRFLIWMNKAEPLLLGNMGEALKLLASG